MFYSLLNRWIPDADRPRVVRNLRALRKQLDADVPPKNLESDLLLATWNIRDFDKGNRKGFGERAPETFFYIAEVLSRFDFVAVQEINELGEWEKVLRILGPSWEWIATDVTEGTGGNDERLTYLFDKRKVWFQNIAGEVVLPANLLISANVKPKPGDEDKVETTVEVKNGGKGKAEKGTVGNQFRRTPFAALFQSAWFKFEICTVHIYYGSEQEGPELEERVQEIQRIGEFFGKRAKKDFAEGRSLILLGDFNIVGHDHETMDALLSSGFEVPAALREAPPTNTKKTMYYDQIAFRTRPGDLEYLETKGAEGPEARAGSVDIFENVYTEDQFGEFESQVNEASGSKGKRAQKDPLAYYLDWRTYQFSDHHPLWVRLKINDSENYLKRLAGED